MHDQVDRIRFAGGRTVPDAIIQLKNVGVAGKLQVHIKLPWQQDFTNFGLLPIVNGEVVLPVKLAFLGHAKEDKQEVEAIGTRLLSDGFLTWYDEKDLLPGDDWQRVIEREIEQCDYFLAFLSSRSVAKVGYVQRELRYALQQRDRRPLGKRFMIPILLDACEVPKEIGDIHFLRLWEPGAYDKLKAALTATS